MANAFVVYCGDKVAHIGLKEDHWNRKGVVDHRKAPVAVGHLGNIPSC